MNNLGSLFFANIASLIVEGGDINDKYGNY